MRKDLWTNEEDEILRGFWKKHGSIRKHAHLLPGRSPESIQKRGHKLGLGERITWTAEEDARIREIWFSGFPVKSFLNEFPNRTFQTINSRAYTLGLGKRPLRSNGVEATSTKLVRAELKKADGDVFSITEATGLNISTVYAMINRLHGRKEIHITTFERAKTSAKWIPIYTFGQGKDAECPSALTSAEKERRRRALLAQGAAKGNPFATIMAQVMDIEPPAVHSRGRYTSRVIQMEAA